MGCLPVVLAVLVLLVRAASEPVQDKQALLSFFNHVPHSVRIDWSNSTPVCSWSGVSCDPTNTSVVKLRLPAVDLSGSIPPKTIGLLAGLRVLSLRANNLTGSIPLDFKNLSSLRSIYLQGNSFSGPFPLVLTNLPVLKCLAIAGNSFSGEIPFAVNNLSHLKRLFLQNNSFSGSLPSAFPPELIAFNVSYNHLNGSIPSSLSRFSTESFAGNDGLCGAPLISLCKPFFPPPGTPVGPSPALHKSKKHRIPFILLTVFGGVLVLLLCFLVICCLWRRRKRNDKKVPDSAVARVGDAGAEGSSSKDATAGASISASELEKNKLAFFNGGGNTFDLEDLLRASAEVLGKGSVGTSYKAVLEDGITVVVKRLKDVSVSRREFDAVMDVLGEVAHDNVIPLRAYYYSRDEKLLVYDFLPTGSLAVLLHGRGKGRAPLDWDSRLRAVLGVAKGLAHLHVVNKVVHGNVKASNVLLRPDHTAAVSEFGLNSLFGNATQISRLGGYRAPEVVEAKKVTFKSDVYSFGVLLLEILTGKAPNQTTLGEEGIDLPRWVQSVVREEWTAEVFDVELMRFHNIEEEMVQLLQIAMSCVSMTPDQRPSMQEVLKMIVEVHHGETDDTRQSSDDQSK